MEKGRKGAPGSGPGVSKGSEGGSKADVGTGDVEG